MCAALIPFYSIFKSDVFKIFAGSSTQPFFAHADILARSDVLRQLVQGSWKESVEQTIRWTEWDDAGVEKFLEWLYTNDYTCPFPTPVHSPVEEHSPVKENVGEVGQPEILVEPFDAYIARALTDTTKIQTDATEEPPTKKQKILPLKDLTWSGRKPATKFSQAEEYDKWAGHQLWGLQDFDYGTPFHTHAELYLMGCRYLLDDLRSMAWSRLRAMLVTIGRPPPGSPVTMNIMALILDVYDKLDDSVDKVEPLKDLLATFVVQNFTAFQASGIEDWATSENKTAREFIAGLMSKLMLRVEELEDEVSKPKPIAAPSPSIGSGVDRVSGLPNPQSTGYYHGRGRRR